MKNRSSGSVAIDPVTSANVETWSFGQRRFDMFWGGSGDQEVISAPWSKLLEGLDID